MEFDRILKKIQKKQRMLLKAIVSGPVEADQNGRLDRIASGLRVVGIVDDAELALTSKGRDFVATFGDAIFQDFDLDVDAILEKLLQTSAGRTSTNPKMKKVERLFLTFLSDGPVDAAQIRRAKNLIPHLSEIGQITVAETISLTDLGRQTLGENISADAKQEARARFFTSVRSDGRNHLKDRAERFLALYRNGFTYQEIGDLHGLTRERVRQILNVTPNFAEYLKEHEESERQREIQKQKDVRLKKLEKSLANQFPERVDELWDYEKNQGLDPTQIASRSASVEIWWKCPVDGHSWEKRPSDIAVSWWRSKTSGCPKCAGKTKKPVKQEKLSEAYPEFVSRYWDFEKNQSEGLDPKEVTLASNWRAWLKCPKDSHSWQARIHSTVKQQWSLGNAGCRVCNGTIGRKVGEWGKARKVSEEFPEQVEIYWDYEQNDQIGIKPTEITIGSSKLAWFRCPVDGHCWTARIVAIRSSWSNDSSGCPACHGRSKGTSSKLTDTYPGFIAEVWDFEQNEADGLSYERLTTGSNKTVSFRCSKDGTRWFEQIKEIVKYWHTGRSGCPKCNESRRIRNRTI